MKKNKQEEPTDYSQPENLLTRLQAIKEKCMDCMCEDKKAVKNCDLVTCPLWAYRTGKCRVKKERKKSRAVE